MTAELATVCPYCGKRNDRHSCMDNPDAVPRADSLALCIDCGGWAVFTGNGGELRLPTDAEVRDIATDPDCNRHIIAWLAMDIKRRMQLS